MGELGRKGWKEVGGTANSNEYHSGGYGQVGGENYHSPGEKSSLVGSGNGCVRDEDWSCSSQQGSKASSPRSPNQNWDNSWGYQNDNHGSYQSDIRDMSYNSNATSPSEEKSQKTSKKERKPKEQQNKNDWNDKWGDDELWESLNK